MTKSRHIKFSSTLATMALLFGLSSCTDEIKSPTESMVDADTITLSLLPEGETMSTRGAISDGSMVDHLYYAIYKGDKDASGEVVFEEDPYYAPEGGYPIHADYSAAVRSNFRVKLIPEPDVPEDRQYKIVCWAQYGPKDSNDQDEYVNPYYDLSGFPNIKVNYTYTDETGETVNFLNNDEARDAFYASQVFTANQKGSVIQVVLTRPFAQINIGTSGWDYEGAATVKPNERLLKYSKIIIKGAATKLNLLDNKTEDKADELQDITYDYSQLPAYRNISEEEMNRTSSPVLTGEYAKDHAYVKADPENGIEEQKGFFTSLNKREEFLYIDLDQPAKPDGVKEKDFHTVNKDYADYISWSQYDNYCANSGSHDALIYNIYTETFKYLSMSYVLVPFEFQGYDENGNEKRSGSTVEVQFNCSTGEKKDGEMVDIFGSEKHVVDLKNVPACSNHRTNIIAADGTGFFMSSNEMYVAIYSETFADYYKRARAWEKDWDETQFGNETGNDLNDEFGWPGDDVDQDAGKAPLIMADLFDETKSRWINVSKRYVDVLKFMDESVTFKINPYAGWDRYSDVAEFVKEGDVEFEYYIGDTRLPSPDPEKDLKSYTDPLTKKEVKYYEFNFTVDELNKIVDELQIGKEIAQELEEYEACTYNDKDELQSVKVDVPALKYYPVEFRVKTNFLRSNDKFKAEDLVVTVRLMSSYKFTFSQDSEDEGVDIINYINKNGTFGSDASTEDDEKSFYFITDGNRATSQHLAAVARNTAGNANNKLFAFNDHLRLRGGATETGHWIILNGLRENCDVTVKLGRDAGVDNSSNQTSGTEYPRNLHINWGQTNSYSSEEDLYDGWAGIDPSVEGNIGQSLVVPSGRSKTVFKNSETKILKGKTEIATSSFPQSEVKVYVESSGHSYYWIILSEPEN